ncbi:MAG: hypothetical protein RIB65_22130 [Ilumatobacter fluminis]|uniref:hypothetical protein n=1 Tax=Ilumatobacter fluminis TaxID=467091 RepID=UPI0032EA99DB
MADTTTWAIAVSIASPIISAGAALTATWITNGRHDKRVQIAADESRRRDDRELVVDVLLPAREWTQLMEVLLPALWKMSHEDLVDFVDTDTGVRQREVIERRDVAITRARLFLSNAHLREVVGRLSAFLDQFPDTVMGPIYKDKSDIKVVGNGLAAIDAFSGLIDTLESDAIAILTESRSGSD